MTGYSLQERAEALSYSFGSFRPSDRRSILFAFQHSDDGSLLFIESLKVFHEGWAMADWLEDYSVERVGIWIAANFSPDIQQAVFSLATDRRSVGIEPNRAATFDALIKGLGSAGAKTGTAKAAAEAVLF